MYEKVNQERSKPCALVSLSTTSTIRTPSQSHQASSFLCNPQITGQVCSSRVCIFLHVQAVIWEESHYQSRFDLSILIHQGHISLLLMPQQRLNILCYLFHLEVVEGPKLQLSLFCSVYFAEFHKYLNMKGSNCTIKAVYKIDLKIYIF